MVGTNGYTICAGDFMSRLEGNGENGISGLSRIIHIEYGRRLNLKTKIENRSSKEKFLIEVHFNNNFQIHQFSSMVEFETQLISFKSFNCKRGASFDFEAEISLSAV